MGRKCGQQRLTNRVAQGRERERGRKVRPAGAKAGTEEAIARFRQGCERVVNVSPKCGAGCLHQNEIRKTGSYVEVLPTLSNDAGGLRLASCLDEGGWVRLSSRVQVLPGFFVDGDLCARNLRIMGQKMFDQLFGKFFDAGGGRFSCQ